MTVSHVQVSAPAPRLATCAPMPAMGKPWASVPCINTEHGLKVKTTKQVEARLALSAAGLSPVGDRHELLKRLAVHNSNEDEKRKKEV